MSQSKGYKAHISKNVERILTKVSNPSDKWAADFLIHIKNTKKHSNLCGFKSGRIYAPLPIKRAYMNDIWLSELPPPPGVDTQELLDFVIEDDGQSFKKSLQAMAPSLEADELDVWFITMKNLYVSVNELFGKNFDETPLSEDLVKSIHLKVTLNVLETSGEYRTVEVGAAGSSVKYESPQNIRPRLISLIEVVNEQIANVLDFESAVALGGFFLSEFLLIHPFRDGNGRTSRLLLSHLLRHWTVVPVSLYLHSNREYYIKAMQSRTGTALPLDVITYVAQCVEETILLHYCEQLDAVDDGSIPAVTDDEDVRVNVSQSNLTSRLLVAGVCIMIILSHFQKK